jgi:hypothetical protein
MVWKSHIEYYLEDTLIDLMIAFEALVFEGEGSESKGRTIAIANSMLIGENEKERRRIRTRLLEAYRVRNVIIHSLKKDYSLTDELVLETRRYYRRAFKKIIARAS